MTITRRRLLAGTVAAASLLPLAASRMAVPVRIMAMGDSITKGTGGTGLGGYRVPLHNLLTAGAAPAGLTWRWVGSQADPAAFPHEGHGGWTITQMIAAAPGWCATADPDLVLLHAGTNDIRAGVSSAAALDSLATLIRAVRAAAPGVPIYVARIIAVGPGASTDERARNNAYSNGVPALVRSLADPLVVDADMRSVAGALLADDLHPNTAGYTEMSWRWYDALRWTYAGGSAWNPLALGCRI